MSLLQEEKAGWVDEKRRLVERLQANTDDPVTGTGQLRRQVETLKEEIYKLENCWLLIILSYNFYIKLYYLHNVHLHKPSDIFGFKKPYPRVINCIYM